MMTEEQKYLFDLQGWLLVPEMLSADELTVLNQELDRLLDTPADQFPGSSSKHENCADSSVNGTDTEIFCITECGPAFEALIDHPNVMPYMHEMINHRTLRMTHAYAIARYGGDATTLHRGRIPVAGQCQFRFENGQFHCNMIKVVFCLTDLEAGDGGFSVISGSHKSNFKCFYFDKHDTGRNYHPDDVPVLTELTARRGDAIIFSEDLTHGARTNRSGKERRNVYYSYQPSYMPDWMAAPSEVLLARLTPEQRALMEPPHY